MSAPKRQRIGKCLRKRFDLNPNVTCTPLAPEQPQSGILISLHPKEVGVRETIRTEDDWKVLDVHGLDVKAKVLDNGSLKLVRRTVENDKGLRYQSCVDNLKHELDARIADTDEINKEVQNLIGTLGELGTETTDKEILHELWTRAKVIGKHKECIRQLREKKEQVIYYSTLTTEETVVIRPNCLTRLKRCELSVVWLLSAGKEEEDGEIVKVVEKKDEKATLPIVLEGNTGEILIVKESSSNPLIKLLQRYNVKTNTWSKSFEPFWIDQQLMEICYQAGSLYIVGTWSKVPSSATTSVRCYNVGTTFHTLADLQEARSMHCVVAYGNFLFVLGGRNNENGYLNTVERYNIATDTWEYVKPMSVARAAFSACMLNGHLVVFGGRTTGKLLDSVERYNLQTNTWSSLASMKTKRGCLSGAVIANYLYACGGISDNGVINTVERYDDKIDQWVEVAPMLENRMCHKVVACGTYLFSMGGINSQVSVERYNAVSDTWEAKTLMNPNNTFRHAFCEG